ncbi:MAG TPA: PilZ domain-containing protein [Terriglobia bacterium]|nr:PilZ domain-containing protein [Terriglobia bacterium]
MTEPSNENQRSQRRVEAAIPIRVRGLDASGQEYDDSTTALEVSRRGLSFLTRHELAIFANLTVVIPGLGPTRPDEGATDFFTEATVVGSVKEDDEFYRVGVRFIGATLPMYSAEGI